MYLPQRTGETLSSRGTDRGKGDGSGKFRGANLVTFSTDSPKLSWMNDQIAFWEIEADASFDEFTGIAFEWK